MSQQYIKMIKNPTTGEWEEQYSGCGTAEDSEKLGGNVPDHYATAESVSQLSEQMVDYRTAVNLLDNSDFEIAQAGYGGYHGADRYAADRWSTNASSITGLTKGIRINGGTWSGEVRQWISNPASLAGKTLTYAVKMRGVGPTGYLGIFPTNEDGAFIDAHVTEWTAITEEFRVYTVTCQIPQNAAKIYVATNNPNEGTSADYWYEVEWAALYEGSYTAETLPPYVPKGYGAELAECQRYYVRLGISGCAVGFAHAYATDGAYCFVPTPVTMRSHPSAITFSTLKIGTSAYNDGFARVNSVSSLGRDTHGVSFWANSSELTPGNFYIMDAANLEIFADL